MAVIESKGDGYALYNGVKLPNIDTVWTDKNTYPYAFVVVGKRPGTFELFCCNEPFVWNGDGITASDVRISRYAGAPYVSFWQALDKNIAWDQSYSVSLLWSSYDFSNIDGSVYLSSSSPISLDGMTVIEWDGVTDGLEVFAEGYYKIADFSPASAGVVVSEISGSDTPGVVSYFGELQGTAGSWAIASGSTSKPVVYGIHEEDATTADVSAGIYATAYHGTFPDGGTVSFWASIIAYTPATEEPEDTSKKDFWNGVACGLCGSGTPNFSDTSPFGVGYITGCKLRALREKKEPVYE